MMRPLFALAWLVVVAANVAAADNSDVLEAKSAKLKEIRGDEFVFDIAGEEQRKTADDFSRFGSWNDSPRGAHVLLVDGSVLVGDVLKIVDEKVFLGDAAGLGRCRFDGTELPLAAVRGIIYQPAAESLARDRRWLQIQTGKPAKDTVHLIGGETLPGLLLGSKLSEKEHDGSPLPLKFQLSAAARQIEILPGRIEALALNATLLQAAKQPPKFWLGLSDGNWLACEAVNGDKENVAIKTAADLELRTPLITDDELTPQFWQAVTYLEPASDKFVYLSDLKPAAYKHLPFLTVDWPYELDRSVVGGRLRTSSAIARKGIGMHATSTLDFEVPAAAETFRAEVAIDETAPLAGHAIVRVLLQREADGKFEEAQAVEVSRRDQTMRSTSISVKNARRLRLEVTTADDSDTGDHVDWCYARFLLP